MTEGEVTQESEVTQTESTEAPDSAPDSAPTAQEILDLEKVEKFVLDGQELTPKELRARIMRQADYTQKTQSLSEERKAFEKEREARAKEDQLLDVLEENLKRVQKDPALAAEFKSLYPKRYHHLLGQVLPANTQTKEGAPAAPPEWDTYKSHIDKLLADNEATKAEKEQAQVNSHLSAIDAAFAKLQPKYSLAKETDVILAAQKLLAEKDKAKQPKNISEEEWEKLFKTAHEDDDRRYKAHYSKQVGKQNKLNQEGKDVASGGGTPGGAPRVPKTIKEATEMYLQEEAG